MRLNQLLSIGSTAFLAAAITASSASAQNLQVSEVASGFAAPLFLCSPPGDTS